jgi:hypothetical protein
VTKANLHVEPDARKGKFAGKRKANFIISRPIAKMFDRIPNQERSEGRNNLIQVQMVLQFRKRGVSCLDQGICKPVVMIFRKKKHRNGCIR